MRLRTPEPNVFHRSTYRGGGHLKKNECQTPDKDYSCDYGSLTIHSSW